MAVTKTILKNTNQESVVKIAGTAAATTIDLSVDLLAATQSLDGASQRVNIAGIQWVGLANATITITRNSVNILTLPGGGADYIEFAAGSGFVDTIENDSDIVVTIAGAEAQCYLILRKVSGYASKVETAVYGAYDNESAVGS
jgi:hypothetical protein